MANIENPEKKYSGSDLEATVGPANEAYKPSHAAGVDYVEPTYDPSLESKWTRAGLNWESFKAAPGTTRGMVFQGEAPPELIAHESLLLQQKMKPRHLQMIAVGGSIGTGLFVGSGNALTRGGPLGLIIAWLIIGVMLINVTQALGEMCIVFPVSGGYYTLAARMLDPSFAFAMGWNYVLQWAIVLPLEILVAGQTVQYWDSGVPLAVWMVIFTIIIFIFVILGTLGYAEEEFWSSALKLSVVIMFIFIGIICICGGGPASGDYNTYLGGANWQNPGALANGFKGICAVFVTAAFSFAGTELVGLAATETPNPRKALPSAVKQTFWRITIIYITSLTVIGLAIPYDDPRLFNGSGAEVSPFVIVLEKANISGLNHLINTTICISVLSIGLSCVYAGSRTLTALAETGYAPKLFTFVDKAGRPMYSIYFVMAWFPLAFINLADVGTTVFDWLVALSGLSTLFTWGAICVTHIRFRKAWKVQGHSLEELPFTALGGVYGSWCGTILIAIVLIAQFYIGIFPIEDPENPLRPIDRVESFFQSYIAAFVVIIFWIVGYAWKRTLPKKAHEIDLDTGRKSWLTVEEMREYRAMRAQAPLYVRVFRALFGAK